MLKQNDKGNRLEEKEELLKRLGKSDGYDDIRWFLAIDMAGEFDKHVNFCFESVISLENDGLIKVEDYLHEKKKRIELISLQKAGAFSKRQG